MVDLAENFLNSKWWTPAALNLLESSLEPLPTERNEIDWKSDLSENNERLSVLCI